MFQTAYKQLNSGINKFGRVWEKRPRFTRYASLRETLRERVYGSENQEMNKSVYSKEVEDYLRAGIKYLK